MRASTVLLALLPAAASAHFTLNYPTDRGDNDETQATSPCGGKNTPSSTRTKWPLSGGSQLSLEAGHDEANTAVYLALGNNPSAEDFKIIVKDEFLQVGLGTFCWNDLTFPANLTVKEGDNATIQVVQQGHTGGGLYNCADITFTSAAVKVNSCSNSTGVSAEPATGTDVTGSVESNTASATGSAASATGTNAASSLRIAGGAVVAGIVGAAAWVL